MSNNLTTQSSPPPPTNSENYWQGVVKALPGASLATIVVLAGFLYNANNSIVEYRRRIEMLEIGKETNAKGVAENALANHNISIKLAEFAVIQQNVLIAIADLKTEHRELKARVDGRK